MPRIDQVCVFFSVLKIVQLLYDRPKHFSMCLVFLILCGPISFSYCDLSWAPVQNSNCDSITCRQVANGLLVIHLNIYECNLKV